MPFDLFFQRTQHLNVILLLPPEHINVILELIVVSYSVIIRRNRLVKVGLQVFYLCLQHHIVGFTVLFLQVVQLSFLLLKLLTHRFQGVLDTEKLSLLLLQLASVVVNFSLKSLKLCLSGIDSCQRFIDGVVRFKPCVHILVLFSKADF